jgi:hypothetical protein
VSFIRNPQFVSKAWFVFKALPSRVIRKGFRCLIYLDDLLVLMANNAFAKRKVSLLLDLLRCFGLTVNLAKSNLHP